MKERSIPAPHLRLAIFALFLATAVCVAMILGRGMFIHRLEFQGFIWNVFLAWIPLACALRIHALAGNSKLTWGRIAGWGSAWFFFFPNAPYIVTDLVHWKNHAPVPKWFDLVLIMTFAWTGLLLGYLSLYLIQEQVRRWKGRNLSWTFVAVILALSSFAIYLGRFERWNSWDVLVHPLGILKDVIHAGESRHAADTLPFSITFFVFSLLSYLTLFTLTHLHGWTERQAPLEPREESPLPPAL